MIGRIRLPRMNEIELEKEKERITVRVELKVFRSDAKTHDDGNCPAPNGKGIDKLTPRLPQRILH